MFSFPTLGTIVSCLLRFITLILQERFSDILTLCLRYGTLNLTGMGIFTEQRGPRFVLSELRISNFGQVPDYPELTL